MDELIINMLNALGAGPTSDFADLMKAPDSYNSTLYEASLALHNTAVKPITATVLSIMIVLMLTANSGRIQEDGQLGVRIIAATMIKAVMVIIVAQQAINILSAIDTVAVDLANSATTVDTGDAAAQTVDLGTQLQDDIKDAGTVDKLGVLVVLFIPFMVAKVVGVLAIILIFVRFIQLYIMTSFASLPLAFLAHDETKSIGIGYLKRYAGVALTGVVIIVTLRFYQAILSSWVTQFSVGEDESVVGFATANFGSFFVAPLVLAFLLFGASQLAKALVGE